MVVRCAIRVMMFILIRSIKLVVATWILSDHTTWIDNARENAMAVGVYNDTIYVLGGWGTPYQVVQYQWTTNTLLDVKNWAIQQRGPGQYWSQNDHHLYLIASIESQNSQLAVYDLATNTLTADLSNLSINADGSNAGTACLASDGPYLYVVGGKNVDGAGSHTLQLWNTITAEWTTNLASLHHGRRGCGCIVHHDYLWVFGGWNRNTIERIHITNIEQNQWSSDGLGALTVNAYAPRCVLWRDHIYIIGGATSGASIRSDIIHVMDAATGTVTVFKDRLPYVASNTAPIIVDGVLYVFGGLRDANDDLIVNQFAYYMLRSAAPTHQPSDEPSRVPTHLPSFIPSTAPTPQSQFPSVTPIIPSSNPTSQPSHNPSNQPSVFPSDKTMEPTLDTFTPSHNPTHSPTVLPSDRHTSHPTNSPFTPFYYSYQPSNPTLELSAETTHNTKDFDIISGISGVVAIIVILCVLICVLLVCTICICKLQIDAKNGRKQATRMQNMNGVEPQPNMVSDHKESSQWSESGAVMQSNVALDEGTESSNNGEEEGTGNVIDGNTFDARDVVEDEQTDIDGVMCQDIISEYARTPQGDVVENDDGCTQVDIVDDIEIVGVTGDFVTRR